MIEIYFGIFTKLYYVVGRHKHLTEVWTKDSFLKHKKTPSRKAIEADLRYKRLARVKNVASWLKKHPISKTHYATLVIEVPMFVPEDVELFENHVQNGDIEHDIAKTVKYFDKTNEFCRVDCSKLDWSIK